MNIRSNTLSLPRFLATYPTGRGSGGQRPGTEWALCAGFPGLSRRLGSFALRSPFVFLRGLGTYDSSKPNSTSKPSRYLKPPCFSAHSIQKGPPERSLTGTLTKVIVWTVFHNLFIEKESSIRKVEDLYTLMERANQTSYLHHTDRAVQATHSPRHGPLASQAAQSKVTLSITRRQAASSSSVTPSSMNPRIAVVPMPDR